VYLVMNLAAFAVIIARERETVLGDDISALNGLGSSRPALAWPMTVAMLSLAGIPATAGFMGKFFLIEAAVDGNYAWLGVVIVIGSMISLAYYLRVVAAIWMRDAPVVAPAGSDAVPAAAPRPALAGGSPESAVEAPLPAGADAAGSGRAWELTATAMLFGAATLVLGIVPQPLFDLVARAGDAFTNLV
jgi:NADH-quinone oxidoreductase subunit N